jgi:aspartyl-tRNA(Asn)/glutamyl-tRNA(Gln) amidotransferase subunit A
LKQTIRDLQQRLKRNELSSVALAHEALSRIEDRAGEGKWTFTKKYREAALKAAAEADASRSRGFAGSAITGVPISIKDLFDVRGEITQAGSNALQSAEPASNDAQIVARLLRAGAVIVGKTNMSEFAFTGVGINPHFGTPANPYDRQRRLIPGGSSSGAPVSVADRMAIAAIGTDTGGSVRIPAALCGLVGFKPTQRRVSRGGVFPLSPTLDSVGVIANTVSCCAEVDAVISAEQWTETGINLSSTVLAIPDKYFLDDLDERVARAFQSALSRLSAAGAKIIEVNVPEVAPISEINSRGGISAPEAYAYHRSLLANFDLYDPLVRERIFRGKETSAADYLDMLRTRAALIESFNAHRSVWDALICPTLPIIAPEIAALEADANLYRRTNRLLLRNPSVVNFLDGCALSIPCHEPGAAPVGLMLIARTLEDHKLLNLGIAVEPVVSDRH